MKRSQEVKLLYLKRLLEVYLNFVPYDGVIVDVENENENEKLYVRVGFYKNIKIVGNHGVERNVQNKREIKFVINEIGKLVNFYKNKLRTKFKERHEKNVITDYNDV